MARVECISNRPLSLFLKFGSLFYSLWFLSMRKRERNSRKLYTDLHLAIVVLKTYRP